MSNVSPNRKKWEKKKVPVPSGRNRLAWRTSTIIHVLLHLLSSTHTNQGLYYGARVVISPDVRHGPPTKKTKELVITLRSASVQKRRVVIQVSRDENGWVSGGHQFFEYLDRQHHAIFVRLTIGYQLLAKRVVVKRVDQIKDELSGNACPFHVF